MQCVNNFTNVTFCNGKLITELDYRRIYELAQSNIVKFEAQFSTSTSLLTFVPYIIVGISFQNSSLLSIELSSIWIECFHNKKSEYSEVKLLDEKTVDNALFSAWYFLWWMLDTIKRCKKCHKMKQHKSKATKRIKCCVVLLFQNGKR